MNALTKTLDIPAFDPISYDAAVRAASIRAQHSFFDQHVIDLQPGAGSGAQKLLADCR